MSKLKRSAAEKKQQASSIVHDTVTHELQWGPGTSGKWDEIENSPASAMKDSGGEKNEEKTPGPSLQTEAKWLPQDNNDKMFHF